MQVFLASLDGFLGNVLTPEMVKDTYALESFFYIKEATKKILPLYKDFLLDSGAFTFFSKQHTGIAWEEYVDRYADFINQNHVKKFFELDIDTLIGYEKVKVLRKRLETQTHAQCIPVWHKGRGKEEFFNMCDEYPYVALGGIVSGEIKKEEHPIFTWFINEAHKRKAKIHGLGYTSIQGLKKYAFDSVDSTSWKSGGRFGSIYKFTGKDLEVYSAPAGKRGKDYRHMTVNNFEEWVKFQKWADTHL